MNHACRVLAVTAFAAGCLIGPGASQGRVMSSEPVALAPTGAVPGRDSTGTDGLIGASDARPSQGTRDDGQVRADTAPPPPPSGVPQGAQEPGSAPPSETLGARKPPPEVQKEIERNHADDARANMLQEAARAHPDDAGPQVAWLQGLLDMNRTEEILQAGPALLEKFSRSSELFVCLGRALLRDGQTDLAALQFQRALGIDPSSARTHSLAGKARFIKGDLKGAEAEFQKALTLDANMQEVADALALLFERSGRYAEALALLKTSGASAASAARRSQLAGFVKARPVALPEGFAGLTVPFVSEQGFPPAIRVRLGDTLEKYLVIDTASEDVTLTSAAARSLGLLETEAAAGKDAKAPEPTTRLYALLERITIGDVVIGRIPVRVAPGLRYPDEQIVGALGRAFLRNFRVVMDYPAKTITLTRADGPPLEGVPFDLASVILLDAYNGDKAVGKFVLDTSSYTPGAMDVRFVAEETGFTIFSEDVKKIPAGPYLFKFTMPSLKVGGIEFREFPATAVDLRMMARQLGINVRGVVGQSLLRQCRIEIDFRNQRLSLKKAAPVPKPAPAASGT